MLAYVYTMDPPKGPSSVVVAINEERAAVRHVEARRTGTCRFADRVAKISVLHFRHHVPVSYREKQQTCLATIVAYQHAEDCLTVIGMGVGTKFLREDILRKQQHQCGDDCSSEPYGERVRDMHAEVLARRAFRRYLTEAIGRLGRGRCATEPSRIEIIERDTSVQNTVFRLKKGVTLHFYCSSTPCGNSVVKKFGKMKKEVFREDYPSHCWPVEPHARMTGHSIPYGQFALLVKLDNRGTPIVGSDAADRKEIKNCLRQKSHQELPPKQAKWPVYSQLHWCPPGTTATWVGMGSLHTCSDKLARWNYLGLQGSLLCALFSSPMYVDTMIVGRKFSAMTCRRAVCCRMTEGFGNDHSINGIFRLQHPAIMGTSVYLDETGTIDMTEDRPVGQNVRFYSSMCYVSWLQERGHHVMECLDGDTGFSVVLEDGVFLDAKPSETTATRLSSISTLALVQRFLEIQRICMEHDKTCTKPILCPSTLTDLRELKMTWSSQYENAKHYLLQHHPIMRHWKTRCLDHKVSTTTN